MHVMQCDFCRKIYPDIPAPGWLMLLEQPKTPAMSGFAAMLAGVDSGPSVLGTFCSLVCVAQYATARALADSVPVKEDP